MDSSRAAKKNHERRVKKPLQPADKHAHAHLHRLNIANVVQSVECAHRIECVHRNMPVTVRHQPAPRNGVTVTELLVFI